MRKVTGQAVMGMGLVFAAGAALAQYGDRDGRGDGYRGVVRCESNDNRAHQCPIDKGAGVRLLRRLSDNECVEGRSWGNNRDYIWVSKGCRAEFQVGRGSDGWNGNRPFPDGGQGPGWNGGGNRVVRCDSNDRKTHRCPADTRGGVRLTRKISDASCTEGRSWGYERDNIWVAGGCRAEFEVGRGGGRWNGQGPGGNDGQGPGWGGDRNRIVRCDSNDRKMHRCPADTRGGVRLVRKLSDAGCDEGRSWGYDREVIWVSAGCRAEFETGRGRDRRR